MNRVLRQLRERDLVTFRGGRVVIHDPRRLRALVGYDGSHLDQERRFDPDERRPGLRWADDG